MDRVATHRRELGGITTHNHDEPAKGSVLRKPGRVGPETLIDSTEYFREEHGILVNDVEDGRGKKLGGDAVV